MMFGARAALISGRTIVGHWHGSGCPLLAEAVTSTADYDVLVLDLQHGIIDAPVSAGPRPKRCLPRRARRARGAMAAPRATGRLVHAADCAVGPLAVRMRHACGHPAP
jgi:hypothetical protein